MMGAMGFLRRLFGAAAPDALDNFHIAPYTGTDEPAGSYCAVAIPGETEVDLPPGTLRSVYRIRGKPRFWDRNHEWPAPAVEIEIMPVDARTTPRLTDMQQVSATKRHVIKGVGWNSQTLYTFRVPEPGGRYRIVLGGAAFDDEAHIVFEP